MKNYADWNSHFEDEFNKISAERRRKPGAFLSVVPGGAEWENYLDFVRSKWHLDRITEFPFCLLTLYAGVAFYDYESGDFWKPFAAAVGVESISPAQYKQLTEAFFDHAEIDFRLGELPAFARTFQNAEVFVEMKKADVDESAVRLHDLFNFAHLIERRAFIRFEIRLREQNERQKFVGQICPAIGQVSFRL